MILAGLAYRDVGQPRFSFARKHRGGRFRLHAGRKPRLSLRPRDNSVREPNAQPAPATGLFKGFGVLPQQQKLRVPATPGTAVSSLCIYKDIACDFGDTPKTGAEDRSMQRPIPKLQWERGTGLTAHCLSYPRST